MNRIGVAFRSWKVNNYERKRAESQGKQQSIALGFAWPAPNIGGVRRHLESIEKYSSHPIALYPSNYASWLLKDGIERNAYHQNLNELHVEQHALFHSHVDPRFIRLSRKAQKQGIPWVHTYHALYFEEDWGNKLAPWQIETNDCLLQEARHADCCLAVGSWLADWLKENHGIEAQFLPNGVDIDACDHADAVCFVKKYGFTDFVLFVGSLAKIKNPLLYIEAARRNPGTEFVMIGTGLLKDEIEKTFGIEISGNLKPLGPLPHDETMDAIAACKVFVMTSHREGLPTVLLEAMSMKKPCVAPDMPWTYDVIESELHGLRYLPADLDSLSEKIQLALKASPFELARQRVEEYFTWPVIMRRLDQIYEELLG